MDESEIVKDEDSDLVNVEMECPYCHCEDGYTIIGKVCDAHCEDGECGEKEIEVEDEEDVEEGLLSGDNNISIGNNNSSNLDLGDVAGAAASLAPMLLASDAGEKKSLKNRRLKEELFHNSNGIDYEVLARNKVGDALLKSTSPKLTQYVVAWNCPVDKGSWGQGHYFRDEESAREFWDANYANLTEALTEDTVKNRKGKWVNKGKEGTHGEFKTKKAADAQRKAMFAQGYKADESLDEGIFGNAKYKKMLQGKKCLITRAISRSGGDKGYWQVKAFSSDESRLQELKDNLENKQSGRYEFKIVSSDELKQYDCNMNTMDYAKNLDESLDEGIFGKKKLPTTVKVSYDEFEKYENKSDTPIPDYLFDKYGKKPLDWEWETDSKSKKVILKNIKWTEDESLDEDFKDVSITTDKEHMEMTSDDNGKITITTEPITNEECENCEDSEEVIKPLSDEEKGEIEVKAEENGEEEVESEEDIEDFDEESFDELGESYLKEVYDNVNSYKTTKVQMKNNKLFVEGNINFKSGKTKTTQFIFEGKKTDNKMRLIGENAQITKGKKSFKVSGSVVGKKFLSESFNYNYSTKDSQGKSIRLYNTIKRNK